MNPERYRYLPPDPDDTPITDRCVYEVDQDGRLDNCGAPLAPDADLDEVLCPWHAGAEERGEITPEDFDALVSRYQAPAA
ncbi:hypothetical protein DFP74_5763 [Nocardiopsis sp. Huas11]|uniref:hypothetical protein n=1 Tax=Nocardiopsis sp. Huas11 TaxID=2183912 RepID=UPI000EADC7D6|nr:hypothetical protein [Nocardiopsis sp. Huas11]RKS10017.1 hypothetical protein DFP74_5763 [Nocardiopsis sp. Huas11]